MRIFKARIFQRWMKKTELTDNLLRDAVDEMSRGLVDAELGSGVVKKRISMPGRGKSGSARTIVATNYNDKWLFLFGFEKNERENIEDKELETFREAAKRFLKMDAIQLEAQISTKEMEDIKHG